MSLNRNLKKVIHYANKRVIVQDQLNKTERFCLSIYYFYYLNIQPKHLFMNEL
jgi:hypothetical protein